MNFGNELRLWILARIFGEEAVNVRQQHERVSIELAHDKSAQLVIVSETRAAVRDFQFGCRHGVVLVDDGDDTHIQKSRQRVT